MSAFQFKCTSCKYVTKKYNAWRQHLLEESHQIEARGGSQRWTVKDMEKAVVVFGLGFISASKADVLKHFADFSFVSNYIFWMERPDFCIIQFLTRKFRKNILRTAQIIEGQELFLRPREEITNIEWVSICPLQSQRVKIEVDLEPEHVKVLVNLKVEQSEDSLPLLPPVTFGEEVILNREVNVPTLVVNPTNCNQFKLDRSLSQSQSSMSSRVCSENYVIEKGQPGMNRVVSEHHVRQDFYTNDCHEQDDLEEDMDVGNDRIYEGGDRERIWNGNLERLYHDYQMSSSDWELRNQAKIFIEKLLHRKFPSCVLIAFKYGITDFVYGNGKGTFHMILDAYGHTKRTNCKEKLQMYLTQEELKDTESCISSKLLGTKSSFNINQVQPRDGDRIYFYYLDLSCTLRLNSLLLAQSWRLMQFFCDLDERVWPLTIVVAHWARNHQLVDLGFQTKSRNWNGKHFQPLIFQWLVVFYLIHKNILPSIRTLQNSARVKLMYKSLNIGFCDDHAFWKRNCNFETDSVTGKPSSKCVLQLAQDMFTFLGEIELQSNIISLNMGKVIPIADPGLKNTNYDLYGHSKVLAHLTKMVTSRRSRSSYVFIQHPLQLDVNMTPVVEKSVASRFTNACKRTAGRLQLLLSGTHDTPNPADVLVPDPDPETLIEDLQPSNSSDNISIEETLVPHLAKKESNTKSMSFQVGITKKFTSTAETVKNSEMKRAIDQDGCLAVWMKFFTDFNTLLWPVCFSIKITPVSDMNKINVNTPTAVKGKYKYKLFCQPFQGVLVDPERMRWTNKNQKFYSIAVDAFSKMLEQATLETIPNFPNDMLDRSLDSVMFKCQIIVITSASVGRSKKRAQVRLRFIFSEGSLLYIGKCAKKNFQQMYKKLWDKYWKHRLRSEYVDLH